jgi:oxygen-independent coproporphyrinogen-3 oxidase
MINNQRHATADEKLPFEWQKHVLAKGHGMVVDDALTWEEQGDEFLVMGLRLKEGISPARFTALSGRQINPAQIAALKGYGFVETLPNGNLRVTARGWPVLDAVVADLAA